MLLSFWKISNMRRIQIFEFTSKLVSRSVLVAHCVTLLNHSELYSVILLSGFHVSVCFSSLHKISVFIWLSDGKGLLFDRNLVARLLRGNSRYTPIWPPFMRRQSADLQSHTSITRCPPSNHRHFLHRGRPTRFAKATCQWSPSPCTPWFRHQKPSMGSVTSVPQDKHLNTAVWLQGFCWMKVRDVTTI